MTEPNERRDQKPPQRWKRPSRRAKPAVPKRILRPLEDYFRTEGGGGLPLLVAAVAALVWINVSAATYGGFWETEIELRVGPIDFREDLRHVVNELLMVVFFYVIALEVKREFLFGALHDRSYAVLPLAAAVGGIVLPALVYLLVNVGAGGRPEGWAIPIATDPAFALGALALLSRRVPSELRGFLLTLAVIDDVATFGIIVLFFSTGLSGGWLLGAGAVVALVLLMQRLGVTALPVFALAAAALWIAVYQSGVHPTIAGVLLGFLTPARTSQDRPQSAEAISSELDRVASEDAELSEAAMREIAEISDRSTSPLYRTEHAFHKWSAYLILPIFALANAGVELSGSTLAGVFTEPVGLGIVLGLLVGKSLGVIGFSALAARLAGARLPGGLDRSAIAGVGPLAGIGFTVAIFIAGLSFNDEALLAESKAAILIGSATAGLVGSLALGARNRFQSRAT